ncbi:MAG: flagellar basal body P-ring formation chaperone FlgA, partial [Candidatus Angelobacter sp.]
RLLSFGFSLIAFLSAPPLAAASAGQKQDTHLIQEAVVSFLKTQSAGLPGEVEIIPGIVDARMSLPACAALEASLPSGSRAWGNTTVTVNCTVPSPWTIYVRATVKVMADYVVSARPLTQGQLLTAADFTTRRGDLTQLPSGIITDPGQAFGRTMASSIPFGSLLRQDMLRMQPAVRVNQSVKLVSSGRGFSVTADGKALGNAADGQIVQVRSASGPVVSGIARMGAVVEVSY